MSVTQETNPQTGTDWQRVRADARKRVLIIVGVLLALLLFIAFFYMQSSIVLIERDSADIAQVARNVHLGNGYTTRFLRPLNVKLASPTDPIMPELNRAPLFPYAVSMVFAARHAWSEQAVVWVSLGFLCLTMIATYILGRMLFGWQAGLLAAAIVGTRAPALQAGTSGQEWTMAAFWFVLLMLVIAKHHASCQRQAPDAPITAAQDPCALSSGAYRRTAPALRLIWPIAAALLVGCLFMTSHVLIFVIIPVALYFAFTGQSRRLHLIVFLVCAILACAPWAYRNADLARGSILGASAWDLMADTQAFPGDAMARSTAVAGRGVTGVLLFPMEQFRSFATKLVAGTADVTGAVASMVGFAALAFAVVSMLYRFKIAAANALRGMLYVAVPLLAVVFALFSVNRQCAVIFLPAAAIFGSAYLLLLLDAKKLHIVYYRAVVAGLLLVAAWPALGALLAGKTPSSGEDEALSTFFARNTSLAKLVYTDAPWIVALRTNSTAVWLPRSDADADELDASGLPMDDVWLTWRSYSYPRDEAWYLMRRWRLWRDYVKDPKACVGQVAEAWKERIDRAASTPIHNLERDLKTRLIEQKTQDSAPLRAEIGELRRRLDRVTRDRDTLKERIPERLPQIMETRARSCVLFQSVLGLREQQLDTADQVPFPSVKDALGFSGDSSAVPEGVMLFLRPRGE